MNIVFRTDASVQIGTGHVMRCLTLADELRRQGHHCHFICRDHQGHLGELIKSKGFTLNILSVLGDDGVISSGASHTAHDEWLGVSWQHDAYQTLEVLKQLCKVDWLVVDHYALDANWEQQVRSSVEQVMIIDDLADRTHQADLLLDQNILSNHGKERYRKKVNSGCELLLGPRFSLLGQEYTFTSEILPERNGHILRAMIFVGGSDPHHLTERYLSAFSIPELKHIQLDVVVGKNHPTPNTVAEIVSKKQGASIYSGLPSLAALMVRNDVMLGAGGTTNWERMCLGLTSIVVSVAHNQDDINQELSEQGYIYFLGKAEVVSINDIQSAMLSILNHPQRNFDQSKAMRKLVDGQGVKRIIECMKRRI